MEQIPQSIEPDGMFTGLNIKAIVFGVIADIASTFILGMILMVLLLAAQYGTEIPEDAIDNLFKINRTLYLLLLLGTACTVFGGFIGAKSAGSLEVRHGGWVGTVSLLTSVVLEMLSDQPQTYPKWFIYCSVAAAIPAGVLGGYLSLLFSKAEKSF